MAVTLPAHPADAAGRQVAHPAGHESGTRSAIAVFRQHRERRGTFRAAARQNAGLLTALAALRSGPGRIAAQQPGSAWR